MSSLKNLFLLIFVAAIFFTTYLILQETFRALNKTPVSVDDLAVYDATNNFRLSRHVKNIGRLKNFPFYEYKTGEFPDCCDVPVKPVSLSSNKKRWTLVVFATLGGFLDHNNQNFNFGGDFAEYLSILNKQLPDTDIWLVAVNEFWGTFGSAYSGGFLEKCNNCYDKFLMTHPNKNSADERDYKKFRTWYMQEILARQYGPVDQMTTRSLYFNREILNPFCSEVLTTKTAGQIQRESLIYPGNILLNPKSEVVTYWNTDIAYPTVNDVKKLVTNVKKGTYNISKSTYRYKKPVAATTEQLNKRLKDFTQDTLKSLFD